MFEIEFVDGPPAMEVGRQARLRVLARGVDGKFAVPLERVAFSFEPMAWGRVLATADPGVGLLEVIGLVDDGELLSPSYSIRAQLSEEAGQRLGSDRRIRIVPEALELELAFEVGQGTRWTRFGPDDLRAPIDWSRARVGDPSTQSLFLREGRPYLRIAPPSALPARVEITFPNGEVATLALEGALSARHGGEQQPEPQPRIAAPPAAAPAAAAPTPAAGAAAAGAREEVARLQRYVSSFGAAPRQATDPRVAQGIRERIEREIERVRAVVEGHPGADRDELQARFQRVVAEAERGLLAELGAAPSP